MIQLYTGGKTAGTPSQGKGFGWDCCSAELLAFRVAMIFLGNGAFLYSSPGLSGCIYSWGIWCFILIILKICSIFLFNFQYGFGGSSSSSSDPSGAVTLSLMWSHKEELKMLWNRQKDEFHHGITWRGEWKLPNEEAQKILYGKQTHRVSSYDPFGWVKWDSVNKIS